MKKLTIAGPSVLPLALAHPTPGMPPATLGIALQHPPLDLTTIRRKRHSVTGARADFASMVADRYLASVSDSHPAEIEIELAVPLRQGLSSDAGLALATAAGLAWANGHDQTDLSALSTVAGLTPHQHLARLGFARGGLLLAGHDGQLVWRTDITHEDARHDWVFVMVLQRPEAGIPDDVEQQRRDRLKSAGSRLADTVKPLAALRHAVAEDDLAGFAEALGVLTSASELALRDAGWPPFSEREQGVFAVMGDNGAVATGRSLSGLALWGLIEGASPSQTLRKALRKHLGYYSGTIMASVCDNEGMRMVEDEAEVGAAPGTRIRPRPDLGQ